MSELLTDLVESGTYRVILWMILGSVIIAALSYFLDRCLSKTSKDEPDKLYYFAKLRRCSEYDVFLVAAKKWNLPAARVNFDFKKYLLFDEVPFYVRDYLRAAALAL